MNIKKLVQFGFQTLIMVSLLFTNISNASAQGEDGDDYIGQVSTSKSKSLPRPTFKELGMPPLSSQPLPGGGTGTATAGLSWSRITMDGIARSSLSSNTVSTYNLCARVIRLIMNGTVQGTHSNPVCDDRTGGGSVQDKLSKTVASGVLGKTWKADTYHNFVKSDNSWSWNTSNSITKTP